MKKIRPSVAVEQLQQNDPSLTGLDLSGNSSYEMKCAYYTEEIGKALARNTHLTSLSLSSLTINDSNVVHIANALKENNTLTYLDLSQNKFGTEGLIAISDALKNNNALIELNVIGQSKDFGENGLTHVMEMLDHNIVLKKIVWRLHSRQSFRINNQITRNNEIERRLGSNMSIEDILPESRRGHALPESLTRGSGKTEVKKEIKKEEPKKEVKKEEPKKEEPKKEIKKEEPKKEEPKKEEPKKEETKKEEPKKEEPKKETTKPSGKRYDPDRLTWWVENLSGGAQETISIEDPKQKVYISNITDSFVIVTGKCTKISVEKAKGSGIVFDDIISTVEVVNSSKIQLQANGAVPAIQIDSTHGGTIFIQTDVGLDVTIVTALCSGLNICTPGEKEDDDMIESPIPEQFETKYHENKWHCLPSSHSGV